MATPPRKVVPAEEFLSELEPLTTAMSVNLCGLFSAHIHSYYRSVSPKVCENIPVCYLFIYL
jgi:hypothetical protein